MVAESLERRIVLETPRLTIRRFATSGGEFTRDLDVLAALLAHPVVMHHWPAPLTGDESRAWLDKQLARYDADGCGYWMVELKATGEPIGQAGIMFIDIDGKREAGLGYMIHADHWGRGYATEAAAACVEWAFANLDVARVVAPVRPVNAPSIRVAEEIGMKLGWGTTFADLEHLIYVLTHAVRD